MKIKASRMIKKDIEFNSEEEGICFNESLAHNKVFKVKAGKNMCSVGMIRRGRDWGDYGSIGMYCADCPYFIHPKTLGQEEEEYLSILKEHLGEKLKGENLWQ